ncbi:hypothetical protein N7535_000692 [Penicillium sp. DV-2018c]|nr:hypothetical protein N7461_006055 [Penicillium sp. DV-2018c]KAJ5582072.1 hypothetical protein N7535_000692 [Penicillium sp. DV-2018c]
MAKANFLIASNLRISNTPSISSICCPRSFCQTRAAIIRSTHADGPNTLFEVFGSPYSQFRRIWHLVMRQGISLRFGVRYHWIRTSSSYIRHDNLIATKRLNGMPVGCDALRSVLSLIMPPLAVCGHVHGRGYELASSYLVEHGTRGISPPVSSEKQAMVDLNSRPDNEGFSHSTPRQHYLLETEARSPTSPASDPAITVPEMGISQGSPSAHPTLGVGSLNSSTRFNSALQTPKKETCIVNAAVVATSWPHQGACGSIRRSWSILSCPCGATTTRMRTGDSHYASSSVISPWELSKLPMKTAVYSNGRIVRNDDLRVALLLHGGLTTDVPSL